MPNVGRAVLPKLLLAALSPILIAACGQTSARPEGGNRQATPVTDTTPAPRITPAVARLYEIFPSLWITREFAEPFLHLAVYDSSSRIIGFQVESDLASTTRDGYAGPVPVRVFLDASAKVLGFDVLSCDETPGYVDMVIKALTPRLVGYSPVRTDTIDAVTMATLSSSAVIAAVTGAARRVADEVVNRADKH